MNCRVHFTPLYHDVLDKGARGTPYKATFSKLLFELLLKSINARSSLVQGAALHRYIRHLGE